MADDIGDVSIGVEADATGFQTELEAKVAIAGRVAGKELADELGDAFQRAILKSLAPALAEMRADVHETVEKIGREEPELDIDADTEPAKEEARGLLAWIKAKSAELDIEAKTKEATAKIAVLTRDRIVELIPKVSAAAAAAAAATIGSVAQIGTIAPNTCDPLGHAV